MRLLKIGAILASLVFLCGIVFFKESHKPKIYDCFLFFNELELLEVRLNEMYDHVDKFVIVESTETFTGKPKSLVFLENRRLFEKFADKIIHVPLTEHFSAEKAWARERYQRQQVMQGLKGCHKNDIIFLSDLDEIVKGDRIQEIAKLITSKEVEAVVCYQKMFCGFLNRYQGKWPGTVCMNFQKFKSIPVKTTRKLRNCTPRTMRKAQVSKIQALEEMGWHFNSMGGSARYVTKLESFSHQELNQPGFDKVKHFSDVISPLPIVEIDSSFPLYITNNLEYFKKIGFIDETVIDQ
jgi:hypothetical protein